MQQTLCTIRTINFDAMRDFYRDTLRLRHLDPVEADSIWFRDFQTEIHIRSVSSAADVGVAGFLRLLTRDVLGVSGMFRERGVPLQVRERGATTEAVITDPDGNTVLLAAISDASA